MTSGLLHAVKFLLGIGSTFEFSRIFGDLIFPAPCTTELITKTFMSWARARSRWLQRMQRHKIC